MGYHDEIRELSVLVGETLTAVEVNEGRDEILFKTAGGRTFRMYHEQDCCESVDIEDIAGDLQDLIGSPVLVAEEVSSGDRERDTAAEPAGWVPGEYDESYTWTFYKIDTAKGGVTIRWFGSSNGYYSESVRLVEVLQ